MDADSYLRFVLSFILVIGLILLAGALLRRYGTNGLRGLNAGRRGARRLAVVEALNVDPRRRLVLVRRDDTEHLLLIGGSTDVVVETAIRRLAATPDAESPAGASAAPDAEQGGPGAA